MQLQKPDWHSDVSCFKHAALAFPLRPLAATSSRQPLLPHGGKAVATEAMMPVPSAATANPTSVVRAATCLCLLRVPSLQGRKRGRATSLRRWYCGRQVPSGQISPGGDPVQYLQPKPVFARTASYAPAAFPCEA